MSVVEYDNHDSIIMIAAVCSFSSSYGDAGGQLVLSW